MILETMSFQEIANKYDVIFSDMMTKFNPSPYHRYLIKNKKATNVIFKTRKRKIDDNSYVLIIPIALSYKDFMEHGMKFSLFLVYGTSKGNMTMSKGWSCKINAHFYAFYTSHFFDRYRERLLKDLSIPKDEVIAEFFKRNTSTATEYFKEGYKDAKKSFFMVAKEGVSLGICVDTNKLLFKTFIDFDSLSKNKQEESNYLGELFKESGEMLEKMRLMMPNNPDDAKAMSADINYARLLLQE